MISCQELQRAYDNLYVEIRKYFWSYQAVEALADLEVATYRACPDIQEVRRALDRMKSYAYEVIRDDEDLDEVFQDFEELLDDSEDTTYMELNKVNEVIQQ